MGPKENLLRLIKYQNELVNKRSGSIPSKHVNRPESYRFLDRELAATVTKIEVLKLVSADKK